MNNSKKIISICFSLFIAYNLSIKGEITVFRTQFLDKNAACPKAQYTDGYWVNVDNRFKAYEWKITGGSFIDKLGQPKDNIIVYQNEIFSGQSRVYVTVVWNNVASKNDKAPTGTVTINAYKNDNLIESNIIDKGKWEQDIKSLKDIRPPSLDSSISPPILNFGEQDVRVFFIGPFNFPGIKSNGFPVPVTQYEWRIPEGWRAKTGSPTTSGTYMTSAAEIRLISDPFSGGEVRVRGVNDCDNSGDYSDYTWITFTRKAGIKFLEYPQTVPLGEVDTYKFSVLSLSGVSFEWEAPVGWSINGEGNTYTGGNVVQITTSECPTSQKVRVRLKQGDIISDAEEFPTTVALPAINILGETEQYQPVTFSLDMPDNNIASVEWLVNGSSVGVATNTSSLSFRINESGKVKISAKLTLEGCSVVSIPEIEVDVVKAPDPVIAGPNPVCDHAIYRIIHPLPEATVEWSSSNNIRLVSPQGSNPCVFSGRWSDFGWIEATLITDNGDSITLPRNSVWVGIPTNNKIQFGTFFQSPPNNQVPISRETYIGVSSNPDAFGQGVTGYVWEFMSWSPYIKKYEKYLDYDNGRVTISLANNATPLQIVQVSACNACGYNEISGAAKMFYAVSSYSLILSPNPATDIVTAELQEEQPAVADLSIRHTAKTVSIGVYEIQLWSASTMLRRYTTDQPVYQIPVSGLPAGIYFVRVIKDGEILTKKLIKK